MDRVRPLPLARGLMVLAAFTYALIILGALVRANNAGLSCPDWPLCFGEVLPRFDVKIAFEWGHRALAGSVTLGLLVLTVVARGLADFSSALRSRLTVAWGMLATQVVFGGLTVLLRLAPWTVSVHLLLGTGFCVALVWIALDLYELRPEPAPREPLSRAVASGVILVSVCLVLQLTLGGMVASHYAGLACSTFPTCDGTSLVPTLHGLVGMHVLHRLNGAALLVGFVLLSVMTRRVDRVGPLARAGTRLVLVQIAVGAADVLLRLPPEVTGLHTALAAAIAVNTGLLIRELVRARTETWPAPQRVPLPEAG